MFLALSVVLLLFSPVSGILNGLWTAPADMLSSASLKLRYPGVSDSKRVLCGGVLVSPTAVLTASHCTTQHGIRSIGANVTIADYNIYEHDDQERRLSSWAYIDIPKTGHAANDDLSVVFLPGPLDVCVPFQPMIARLPPTRATLPQPGDITKMFFTQPITDSELTSSFCTVSGWGITEKNTHSHVPMTLALSLEFRNFPDVRGPVLIGRSASPLSKTCYGDSGSPVFCWIRGMRYLVGLLSEIGVDGVEFSLPPNATDADACAARDFVMISDLRKRLEDVEMAMVQAGQEGLMANGQRSCHYA